MAPAAPKMSRPVLAGLVFMVLIIAISFTALFYGKFLGNRNPTDTLFTGKKPLTKRGLQKAEAQEQKL